MEQFEREEHCHQVRLCYKLLKISSSLYNIRSRSHEPDINTHFICPPPDCIYCRNRLESNNDHWNAILLSLRELIEWVIRKNTELTNLGHSPLQGDAGSLQKHLVSARSHVPAKNYILVTFRCCFVLFSRISFSPPFNRIHTYIDVDYFVRLSIM